MPTGGVVTRSLATTCSLVAGALVLAAASAVSAASPVPQGTVATPATWSVPTRILAGRFDSVSIAVDSADHLHIAATESSKGLYYLTDRSGSWHTKRLLEEVPDTQHHGSLHVWEGASITLDEQDRVHIVVTRSSCNDCAPGNYDGVFYLTDKGRARGTFPSAATQIAPAGMFEPTIKESAGRLYVTYAKCACIPEQPLGAAWLATRTTGAWTRTKIASHADAPSLRVADTGFAVVAFNGPSSIQLAEAHSVTGDFTVSTVPGTTINDYQPSLALDSHNAPRIAWIRYTSGAAGRGVRYITRGGSTWAASREIVHGAADVVGLSLDGGDNPHFVVGATGVREARLVGNQVVTDTIDSNVNVTAAAIRAPASGHTVIAYAAYAHDPAGIYVARD
jgi:hypothetical protein